MERNSNIENDAARMELIDKLVQKASQKQSPSEKNSFYKSQLPKVNNFNIEDCIEKVLDNQSGNQAGSNDVPVLRTFETLDFDALTKGFEPEELNEGKLVLYITEKQLLQLLKQRAIVVPNKSSLDDVSNKKFSLLDEKIGSRFNGRKGPSQVELIVNQNQPRLSKTNESKETLPKNSYDQQIYDNKSINNSFYDHSYKDKYLPKVSNQSASILYEETFEHIRTVSEASGKDKLPSIKPGSSSVGDDYYAKINSKEYTRLNNQQNNFVQDKVYTDNLQNNFVLDKVYPDNLQNNFVQDKVYTDNLQNNFVQDKVYTDNLKMSSRKAEKTQSSTDAFKNQVYPNDFLDSSQSTGARVYSLGADELNEITRSKKLTNTVSNKSGLRGSVYIGDSYPNQPNIINDILQTATKLTDGIKYSTIYPTDVYSNLAANFETSPFPSANNMTQAREIENQALAELDKLISNLSTNVNDDKINWAKVQNNYINDDELKNANVMKNYVTSLIEHERTKSKQLEQLDGDLGQKIGQDLDKLKVLDGFINKVVDKNEVFHDRNESASHSIRILNDLIDEIKNNIRSRNLKLEDFKTGHKIIIKTTRRLPPRVISQSATNVATCNDQSSYNKKRFSSSFLNESGTRVYELGAKDFKKKSLNSNFFNSKQNVDYSVHSYEPIIDSSLGQASNEKINKYFSIINTGVKNNDLIQIHPLLNNKTEINTKTNSGRVARKYY